MPDYTETIRNLYDALGGGDKGTVLGMLASNVEWAEAEGFPYGGTYVGPEAVLPNVIMKLGTEWDGFAAGSPRVHCGCRYHSCSGRLQRHIQGNGQELQGSLRAHVEVQGWQGRPISATHGYGGGSAGHCVGDFESA